MVEEEHNLIETPILKNVYQIRIKSNSKKKNIDSFVCNDYDDSIDEVDPNIIVKEVVKDINKSSAEYTEDNSNNEESHSAVEEQNTEDSDLVKTPTVKKRGRPKKIVRDNENKTKGREYKVEDDDDNEANDKRKRNQKNNKRKIMDESSSEFEVTTTSSKGLSQFPDCKKLNMFREKFEETTTGIDNDDTTESGNSDLQRMKNKERNEEVHHILNEDDKVDDSCPAVGVCSVIEVNEVKLSEVKDLEKEKQ
nr:hypothetical protein [Tanacetum cinerariifolium]